MIFQVVTSKVSLVSDSTESSFRYWKYIRTYFCRDNSTIKGNTIHRGRASCFLNTPNINRLLILLTVFRGYLVQIRSGKSTRVYVPTGASRIARGIVSEYNAAVPV